MTAVVGNSCMSVRQFDCMNSDGFSDRRRWPRPIDGGNDGKILIFLMVGEIGGCFDDLIDGR